MSVSASIPTTVKIRRSRLIGLIVLVAALAATVTWAVTTFSTADTTSRAVSSPTRAASQQGATTFTLKPEYIVSLSATAPQTPRRANPVMSLTPAQLAGLGLGTGYQLPNAHRSPSAADVLASMSPETRRYTEAVMRLTFAQLAAGAAGHP